MLDDDESDVYTTVDILVSADGVKHRTLHARRQHVKDAVTFRILVENFLQLFGHGKSILARVFDHLECHFVTRFYSQRVSDLLIRADVKAFTVREHRALKSEFAVSRAHNPTRAVLYFEL